MSDKNAVARLRLPRVARLVIMVGDKEDETALAADVAESSFIQQHSMRAQCAPLRPSPMVFSPPKDLF